MVLSDEDEENVEMFDVRCGENHDQDDEDHMEENYDKYDQETILRRTKPAQLWLEKTEEEEVPQEEEEEEEEEEQEEE